MATAHAVQKLEFVELTLTQEEAAVIFKIVASHCFGAGRDKTSGKIYDALKDLKGSLALPEGLTIGGRLDFADIRDEW